MQWPSVLEREFGAVFQRNKELGTYTTWKVGGEAEFFCCPRDEKGLALIFKVRSEHGFPLWILGGGSNVLISDKGLKGLVLYTRGLDSVLFEEKGNGYVECILGAGVVLSYWLREAYAKELGGSEFLTGIPGTIGGALMGNAGSRERYIGELVQWVETIEQNGERIRHEGKEIVWAYRFCSLSDSLRVISRCSLLLRKSDQATIRENLLHYVHLRRGQPHDAKTAGCVFKNPPGGFAGELLDRAGCKGMRCGDAVVSLRHANFIENRGNARAADIVVLIEKCRHRVYETCGVLLEPEVRFLGDEWGFLAKD
jgi:UDP-N-acetylmuramate dehydrogenase